MDQFRVVSGRFRLPGRAIKSLALVIYLLVGEVQNHAPVADDRIVDDSLSRIIQCFLSERHQPKPCIMPSSNRGYVSTSAVGLGQIRVIFQPQLPQRGLRFLGSLLRHAALWSHLDRDRQPKAFSCREP